MPGKKTKATRLTPPPQAIAPDSQTVLAALSGAMAILILSPDGIILAANDNVMTRTNTPSNQLVQQPYRTLFPHGNTEAADALWTHLASGQCQSECITHHAANGVASWIDAIYVPVLNHDGALAQIIVLQSDATARVTKEQEDRRHLELLSLGMNATGHAVCILDDTNRIVYQSAGFTRMLGYMPEDTMGKRPREIFDTQPAIMHVIDEFAAALAQKRSHRAQVRIQDRQHRPLWISIVVNPIVDAQQTHVHAVCIFTDITTLKMQEILQYKAFNAMAHDASLTQTMALVCQEIDEIAPETLSSVHRLDDQQQLLGLAGPGLPAVYHDIAKALMASTADATSQTFYVDQHVAFTELELDPLWENYTHRFVPTGLCAAWMTPVHAANGQTIGLLVLYCFEEQRPTAFHQQLIDLVTPIFALALERETSRSSIERLAYYDALTGLANRGMIKHQASLAITNAANTDTSVAVLFIDLDRFKQVNDSLGHHAGDELLRTIAARLTSVARKTDIVGRLSGDEFVVILTNCQRDKITEIATRIQQTLATPCHINGVPITPSASIGISIFPDNGNTIDTLLHRADLAMYTAKEQRRGSFGFFSDAMNDQSQDTLAMEAALRTAITNRELVLYYQPQVHLQAHRLYGVEALARWEHKEWGMIATDRFIAVAEECGLIGALSQWVLEEACRQLAHWRAQHIDVPCIAVNMSASNFHDKTLAGTISGLLDQYQLPAHCMTLEITETVLMDTNPDTTNNILDIHALGVRFAIDDFGTGYSSLSYLRNLPVSELKLDKSFVRDIETDPTVLALANAVIRIGESLGLTVIAEGVEEAGQYALLRDNLCDVAQGYLFSPPLPANAVAAWINNFASAHRPD